MLFSVTPEGGTNGYGTIFKVDRHGSNYSILRHFSESRTMAPDRSEAFCWLVTARFMGKLIPAAAMPQAGPSLRSTRTDRDSSSFTSLPIQGPVALNPANLEQFVGSERWPALWHHRRGTSNKGTIFRMNKNGSGYTQLYSFNGGTLDGAGRNTALVEADNGLLFGTTEYEGANTNGVLYCSIKMAPATPSCITSLGHKATGIRPTTCSWAAMVLFMAAPLRERDLKIDSNGSTYQEIFQLGTSGSPNSVLFERSDVYSLRHDGDCIFRLKKDGGDFGIIHRFFRDPSGVNTISGGIFFGQDGAMYGTSTTGGRVYVGGTVYRIPLRLITSRQEQVSFPGSNLLFTALAEGITPPCYQWRHDGVALPGQTNSTLLLTNVSLGDRGLYSAMASNTDGVVLSSNVFVHVLVPQQSGPAGAAARRPVNDTINISGRRYSSLE